MMVDHVNVAETWVGENKARKEQRVQEQRGGGRRQRDHRLVSDDVVIDP